MRNGLPRGFVQLDMAAKLQVFADLFMKMQHHFWLVKIGPEDIGACCVIVLAGFGMNMGHTLVYSRKIPPPPLRDDREGVCLTVAVTCFQAPNLRGRPRAEAA